MLKKKTQTKTSQNSSKFLVFQDFEINDLWKIYEKSIEIGQNLTSQEKQEQNDCFTSVFYFNLRIPLLILLDELVSCNEIKQINEPNKPKSYCNIFDNLCDIIDSNSDEHFQTNNEIADSKPDATDRILKRITKEILKNGVLVFFPTEKTRKDCFLKMIENNIHSSSIINDNEQKSNSSTLSNMNVKTDFSFKRHSTQLLFEAFCNLFCKDKYALVKYLINSAGNLFESSENCHETIQFIDKLIKFSFFLNESKETDDKLTIALNDLLNSIQSNVFYSMKEHLVYLHNLKDDQLTTAKSNNIDIHDNNIKKFLIDYANLVIRKGIQIIDSILEKNKNLSEISFKENLRLKNYLTKIIYNFVLWLSELFSHLDLDVCTSIIEILLDFHSKLSTVDKYFNEEEVNYSRNDFFYLL